MNDALVTGVLGLLTGGGFSFLSDVLRERGRRKSNAAASNRLDRGTAIEAAESAVVILERQRDAAIARETAERDRADRIENERDAEREQYRAKMAALEEQVDKLRAALRTMTTQAETVAAELARLRESSGNGDPAPARHGTP